MKEILLIILLLSFKIIIAQDTATINKTGWLVYYSDKVIWFESPINKNASSNYFFKLKDYRNGLIVNHIPAAKYFKSVAKGYSIKALHLDTVTRKTDYTLKDSIWILPVKVKFTTLTRPLSSILGSMGLSFLRKGDEVTVTYNFETNYDIREVQLLRNCDKRKLKRVKNYQVYPPH